MALTLITAAAAEPITLAELKLQCRIDTSDEDALLAIAIAAARTHAENKIGRALINQTWEQTLDAFPAAEIELLLPPVSSVTWVRYVDADGATQTLDPSAYSLDLQTLPGWLLPAYGASWPATRGQANAVTIRYVTGYGATSAAVPQDIRAWLLMTAAFIWSQREAMVLGGKIAEIPARWVDGLLDRYVVYRA